MEKSQQTHYILFKFSCFPKPLLLALLHFREAQKTRKAEWEEQCPDSNMHSLFRSCFVTLLPSTACVRLSAWVRVHKYSTSETSETSGSYSSGIYSTNHSGFCIVVMKLVKSPKLNKWCFKDRDDVQLLEDSKPEGLADRWGSNTKYRVKLVTLVIGGMVLNKPSGSRGADLNCCILKESQGTFLGKMITEMPSVTD